MRICRGVGFGCPFFRVGAFCKHSVWISTNAFSGVSPRPPAASLRDDSDADDACDAVLRISLYHIPDSASLASSASFEFRVFRIITVFAFFNGKPQASFHYKRDGGDDGDGLSCIPLPISHKHRHYRHHRHQNRQAVLICGLPVLFWVMWQGFCPVVC